MTNPPLTHTAYFPSASPTLRYNPLIRPASLPSSSSSSISILFDAKLSSISPLVGSAPLYAALIPSNSSLNSPPTPSTDTFPTAYIYALDNPNAVTPPSSISPTPLLNPSYHYPPPTSPSSLPAFLTH